MFRFRGCAGVQTGVKFALADNLKGRSGHSCQRVTSITAATMSICGAISSGTTMPQRPRPGVRCFTRGWGSAISRWSARGMVAELGYVALAADMFGDRRQAPICRRSQRSSAACAPSRKNCAPAAARRSSTLAALPQVDATRLAAIGFCFGGSVVLELAREGADLKAAVSFHGVLTTKMPAQSGQREGQRAGLHRRRRSAGAAGPGRRVRERDARARRARLAGHQLRQHAAWFHQPRRRRLDDAHRALSTNRPTAAPGPRCEGLFDEVLA